MKHTSEDLTIEQRVDNGIEALDRVGPAGWRERLDLDRLDVGSPDDCVIAQLAVSTADADQNDLYTTVTNGVHSETWKYGIIWGPFDVIGDADDDIAALNAEWKRRLT